MKYLGEGMLWVEGTANAKVLRQYQAWCIWGEVRRPVFWRKVRVRESWNNWNQRGGQGRITLRALELVPSVIENHLFRFLAGERELIRNLTGLFWLLHGGETTGTKRRSSETT